VVLLTGASRGIGPVLAEAFSRRGAIMALAARSQQGLEETSRHMETLNAKVQIFPIDLRESSQRENLIELVTGKMGRIDILVNNAGLETEGIYLELPWQSIRENIEVNLIAPMALTHLVLPGMVKRKSGYVVNIASIAAKSGSPYAAIYSGTKAGLAEWTRALRMELAGTGIRFSTIFPGYVREVGMFSKFGIKSPWIIGSCSPAQVAKAVVKAVEKEKVEIIVNSRPLRYVFTLNEISPALGDWLMRVSGANEFQRKKVAKLR
jgi:short-subunit dehydrogenase